MKQILPLAVLSMLLTGCVSHNQAKPDVDMEQRGYDKISADHMMRMLDKNWFIQTKMAAMQGQATAQYDLGHSYYNGDNWLKQDYLIAEGWLRKAAEQGHADAQFNLGMMYANGQGVVQDKAQAMVWYRKAAKQGHKKAKTEIQPKARTASGQESANPKNGHKKRPTRIWYTSHECIAFRQLCDPEFR